MTILDVVKNHVSNRGFKKYDGEIGLEIETETKRAYDLPEFTFWTVHPDGSLRDFGQEYVLRQPVRYHQQLDLALEEFRSKTEKIKFITDSVTTSVHVHLNMLNETFLSMGNFLTLYSLFENLLIRYSGPDRLSNLFCLPICDAEETYRNMIHMMTCAQAKNYKGMMFGEGSVKYAACNLSAFNQYGSIEIRSFRGETDVKKIHEWVSILYSMLEYSRKDLTPKDIMLSWRNKNTEFLADVFGKHRGALVHPDEAKLIDQNVWYAASVAYCVKDWRALDIAQKPPEFKPKQKELDLEAASRFGLRFEQLDPSQQDYVINKLKRAYSNKYSLKMNFEEVDMVRDGPVQVHRWDEPVIEEVQRFDINNAVLERAREQMQRQVGNRIPLRGEDR